MISLTSPVRTRAHDWPAGPKLAALSLATMLLFLLDDIAMQLIALLAVLLLYRLPGPEFFRAGLKYLKVLLPFVAIILVWHVATRDLAAGIAIVMRMCTAVALANLVTMTTQLTQMMDVIRKLLAPLRRFGVRTAPLELAVPLLIRFAPVLVERSQLLFQAWRARSTRRHSWKLILPVMLLALDDADRVGEALRARGGVLPEQEN